MAAGRPRIYNDAAELERAVIEYFFPLMKEGGGLNFFEYTADQKMEAFSESMLGISDSDTIMRYIRKKVSITGLSLSLGFADKTTLYEYRDREEFSYPIKRAITLIEKYHEEGLTENNVTGRIFALKNMGWKDKTEQEHSGSLTIQQITGMSVT